MALGLFASVIASKEEFASAESRHVKFWQGRLINRGLLTEARDLILGAGHLHDLYAVGSGPHNTREVTVFESQHVLLKRDAGFTVRGTATLTHTRK